MVLVVGEGRSADYVEVLRGVHFVHRRPEDINTRTFRLTCIELKDHYASNQLAVQVSLPFSVVIVVFILSWALFFLFIVFDLTLEFRMTGSFCRTGNL